MENRKWKIGQPASILRFGVPLRAFTVLVLVCLFLGVWLQAQEKESWKRLDLNTATEEELDTLPEVGPKLAKAIVQFREKSGPFRRVEDLLAVPGISKRRLEKIKPLVFVAEEK